jgi:hypothetical protein
MHRQGCVVHCDIHDISTNPHTDEIFVCCDGGIYKTDEMKNFEEIPDDIGINHTKWEKMCGNLANNEFYRIGICKTNSDLVAGGCQDNSCYYYHDNKVTSMFFGDGFETVIHPSKPNLVFGLSQRGGLHVSMDYGDNSQYWGSITGDVGAWSAPFIMDENKPENLYLAKGQLYRINTETYQIDTLSYFPHDYYNQNSCPIFSMEMCRNNVDYIYLSKQPTYYNGMNESQVYMTSNGGKTWQDIKSGLPYEKCFITYFTVDDDNPNHVWASASHYYKGEKIYESFNGGKTWNNISYNLPNVPFDCVRHQPGSKNDIVYASSEMGVWYKTNQMNEWKSYSNNLPNVPCSELEINTYDNKLFVSTFGRGIWVTDLVSEQNSGVNESVHISKINVFPNPASKDFNISISGISEQEMIIQIIDTKGRTYFEMKKYVTENSNFPIETNLESGLYYIRIFNEEGYSKSKQLRIK